MQGNVNWQNGPDAVQLLDSDDNIVDALQYGNAGQFNSGEGAFASDVAPGKTLTRDNAHADTDDNKADFSSADPTVGS
jgi:hypothetical protein